MSTRFSIAICILVIAAICLVLGNMHRCAPVISNPVSDATHDRQVWGTYQLHGEYRLLIDVFVAGDPAEGFGLWAPNLKVPLEQRAQRASLVPSSVEEYETAPGQWPKIRGVLKAGTVLRVVKFTVVSSTSTYNILVFADVIGGDPKFKGLGIVDVSIRSKTRLGWDPNPTMLESYVEAKK